MSLVNIEERIQGLNMKTKELINQVIADSYQQGYKAGQKSNEGQYNRAWKEQANDYIEQGRSEAWEAAIKIHCQGKKCLSASELEAIFGINYDTYIFLHNTASEAISKIKAYEEQQMSKDFRVGDIIKTNDYKAYKAVITWCDGNHWNGVCLQGDNDSEVGMTYYSMDYDNWTKTGKTIPEIMEVLKKM